MSVFVILRIPGDPDTFERYANDHADLLRSIGADGRAAGGTRHAFAGGDGEILVVDEWPDAASFQQFFANQTDIPQLMKDGGAQGPPEVSIYRRLDTPDAF